MMQHTLFVCTLCRLPAGSGNISSNGSASADLSDGQHLFNQLSESLAAEPQIQIQPVRCMGVCSRSCVVAFAAAQKLTFIFSELRSQSVPELQQFSQQYMSQETGNVPYKQRPAALRSGLVAVLPVPLT
jgi:predicted metal-binding protein